MLAEILKSNHSTWIALRGTEIRFVFLYSQYMAHNMSGLKKYLLNKGGNKPMVNKTKQNKTQGKFLVSLKQRVKEEKSSWYKNWSDRWRIDWASHKWYKGIWTLSWGSGEVTENESEQQWQSLCLRSII